MTMDELRFYGAIRGVFEDMTGAILGGGQDVNAFELRLREEYLSAGSPKRYRKWLETELSKQVLTVNEMPVWIETIKPRWPFCNGLPMVYLGKLIVPDTPNASTHASPSAHLFLFGGRVPCEGGWSMKYAVVDQHGDL